MPRDYIFYAVILSPHVYRVVFDICVGKVVLFSFFFLFVYFAEVMCTLDAMGNLVDVITEFYAENTVALHVK